MGAAEEGQQVMLAERVEGDVLDDHHLRVAHLEDRAVDQPVRVHVVAGRQLVVHAVHALRRAPQPLAVRVLPYLREDLAHRGLDPSARPGHERGREGVLAHVVLHLVHDAADVVGQRAGFGSFAHGRLMVTRRQPTPAACAHRSTVARCGAHESHTPRT